MISTIRNIKNDSSLNTKLVNYVNYWKTIDDINLYKEMMYSSLINIIFPLIDKKLEYSGIFLLMNLNTILLFQIKIFITIDF